MSMLEEGADSTRGSVDPNAQDSYGNTVVHMVIIHNQKVGHVSFMSSCRLFLLEP